MKEYSIALKEKPLDEGLSRAEVTGLFDHLNGVHAIPIEVQGEFSTAMGFINVTDAELIDFSYGEGTDIYEFIKGILDDTGKETPTGEYVFPRESTDLTIRIWRD